MAEGGLIEGVFGGDAEEREGDGGLAGADAVAVAVAMDAARHDPELARQAAEYLAKQGRLTDLQLHHFDTERRLAIEAARRKRFSDRIRNGLMGGAALLGLGVVGALAYETWSAVHDHDLVVESFSVPPDLAAKGLTGSVLAAQIRDRLNALQASPSLQAGERASNEPDNPIKVEIPETGVSLGEIGRWLREKFGHETRVSGELYHVTDASGAPALALTVRVGDEPGEQSVQSEGAIEKLIQSGAETAFGATSPVRYAEWLGLRDRFEEGREFLMRLAGSGTLGQRAAAEAELGTGPYSTGPDEDLPHVQAAVRLSPNDSSYQHFLARVEQGLGHDEASYQLEKIALAAPPPASLSAEGREVARASRRLSIAMLVGDYGGAVRSAETSVRAQLADPNTEYGRRVVIAVAQSRAHDPDAARAFIQSGYSHRANLPQSLDAVMEAQYLGGRQNFDWARGDWNAVEAGGARIRAMDPRRARRPWDPEVLQAEALAHLGRRAEADALINATPPDCYPCVRGRGRIAALEGDRAAADRWFAEALRQAPDLAFAETEWGDALLAEGKASEAAAKYASAHAKSPRYADALKGWGDALSKLGRRSDALAKYDEALKLSPHWRELRQARDTAARGA
jgi:tetratricopeptide (TPR) repeat protein